jgi:hypothetical protein
MVHSLYKVVSLLGESEELAPTAEEAALQHVRPFNPYGRVTVSVHREGVTVAFHVDPRPGYVSSPAELPPCFEARQ